MNKLCILNTTKRSFQERGLKCHVPKYQDLIQFRPACDGSRNSGCSAAIRKEALGL